MKSPRNNADVRYRVWIVRHATFSPTDWREIPPGAIAVEPAESGTMTMRRASRYVEAFNRAALAHSAKHWAVAVPVTIRYDGDLRPGEKLLPHAQKNSPLLACQVSACNGLSPRGQT